MATPMKQLKKKRGLVKAKLTRFETFLLTYDKKQIEELRERVQNVRGLLDEFEELQFDIEVLDIELENSDGNATERCKFEKAYYTTMGMANRHLKGDLSDSTNRSFNESVIEAKIKLPMIRLPEFTGKFSEWQSFKDSFTILVHDNDNLSNSQRFHYLKGQLKGEALEVVHSLEITNENYTLAFDLLRKRFENKRLTVNTLIQSIFDIPAIRRENAKQLRQLNDAVTKAMRNLSSLELPVESWDSLLIFIICERLDPITRREWEMVKTVKDLPSMDELIAFLNTKCSMLETLNLRGESIAVNSSEGNKKPVKVSYTVTGTQKCLFCNGDHSLENCSRFKAQNVKSRQSSVGRLNLCYNCLKPGHRAFRCSEPRCRLCNRRHHELLHEREGYNHPIARAADLSPRNATSAPPPQQQGESAPGSNDSRSTSVIVSAAASNCLVNKIALLPTANINVFGLRDKKNSCRVLLDSASTANFVTKELCEQLGVLMSPINIEVNGIAEGASAISHQVKLTIRSRFCEFERTITCLVLPVITNSLPTVSFDAGTIEIPADIEMADERFYERGKIDMLLGVDVFYEILCAERKHIGNNGPTLQRTLLGWVVAGTMGTGVHTGKFKMHNNHCALEKQLSKFWVVEEVQGETSHLSAEDQKCEEIFTETTTRTENGRFMVKLPLKEIVGRLGDSKQAAERRFYAMERRLLKDANLKLEYTAFMQELWEAKISWDEGVNTVTRDKWLAYKSELQVLENIRISRQVVDKDAERIELHGFSDSSERAYGAAIYLKSEDSHGNATVRLLCAKSKVAPLRKISLPRLELSGALLLARLANRVIKDLGLKIDEQHYWCDSTIVLCWIAAESGKWQTFVANRVAEIQSLTRRDWWHHVASKDNAADVVSRGCSPNDLRNLNSWWYGPQFLRKKIHTWPTESIALDEIEACPEKKRVAIALPVTGGDWDIFQKYSSLDKLLRVVSYCMRFVENARIKSKTLRKTGFLAPEETKRALNKLLKIAQQQSLAEDIKRLARGFPLKKGNKLSALSPYFDDFGLIRVGGRLQKAELDYEETHPVILPAHHKLTKLIARDCHVRELHCGPQALLAAIRRKFWPIAGRALVRNIVHNCVKCFRNKPRGCLYLMGELPRERVIPSPPFYNCGVDYAGPLLMKDKKTRGCKTLKVYVCLFICYSTKAIHLELVGSLSTEAFVAALRRFVSRRGLPKTITSDNGTNFVGASHELKELGEFLGNDKNVEKIMGFSLKKGIEWKFNPPRAPHFGGLFEAGIKSFKFHLKRIVGSALLIYEEMNTLLVQIEAVLNSRPLSPLSSNPEDLEPITPGHFLVGRPLTAVIDHDFQETTTNRLSRYELIQKLYQHFWSRWSKEYLLELQQRKKWMTARDLNASITPGVLVLIRDDNAPPCDWSLGRILQVYPGSDGITRVVSVRTARGIFKRPTTRLCVLPFEEQQDNSALKEKGAID